MSNDYTDPAGESEMRRRAAWLLAMLALVAVLLVALMVMFLGGGSGKHGGDNVAFPTFYPTAPASPTSPPASSAAPTQHGRTHHARHHPKAHAGAHSSSVSVPPHSNRHTVNCPGSQPCVANGDIGNAVAAINDYRRQHGQSPVSGSVTGAAQQCAVSNGGNCSGSWAESQVPTANGHEAVQKIIPFADHLLDPGLSSLQVGWAYDPSAKQFYFALIENG